MQIAVCSRLFSQTQMLLSCMHTNTRWSLQGRPFVVRTLQGMDHIPHDHRVHSLLTPFDHALFLNTQNALWGCTLSVMFTRKKKERGEGEGRREEAPGGFMQIDLQLSPANPQAQISCVVSVKLHLHHCSHSQKRKH